MDIVSEGYLKNNNNGTWSKYSKGGSDPHNWSVSSMTYNVGQKDVEVASEFLGFMEYMVSQIVGATKGGTATIAGVSTDIYTTSIGFVLNYDPITKLVFKSVSSDIRNEVTSWNTSVTSFGIAGLP